MIAEVIKLVQVNEFYKINKLVEISKGEYEIITLKNLLQKVKRKIKNR
jgi:hypothetical protein